MKKPKEESIINESPSRLPDDSPASGAQDSVVGRSVFLVETVAAGVSVRTVFLAEDQRLIEMPAIFPDLPYALGQIEELRRVVEQHFAQAARVGAQVIASQAGAASPPPAAATDAPQNNSPAAVGAAG